MSPSVNEPTSTAQHGLARNASADGLSTCAAPIGWWRERDLWLLLAVVAAVYLIRFTALPVCGEESRWANGAKEMLATGDWIVPRQQGEVFPERPPLGSWTMAIAALVRGRMDAVAVRLPSVLAVLATTLLIYGYGRRFMSRLGAMGAAGAYASFGQVLQLGQLGESESVFTFLLAGALLTWHWGYAARWPAVLTWSAAYFLAALAALDKGPQAPVYFVAVTVVFLVLRRDWKFLISWPHAVGIVGFVLVVGAWQVPFILATDWEAVGDIWSGLARDRFHFSGLALHLLSYPWETLGCLLPWSPLLAAYLFKPFRRTLDACRPELWYLATALCVTYPSVWVSAHARGRYFMPLYPCLALLIGVVVERWAVGAPGSDERRAWRWFLRGVSGVTAGGAVVLGVATLFPYGRLADAQQPPLFMAALCLAAITAAGLLWHHADDKPVAGFGGWLQATASYSRRLSPAAILLLLVALLGMIYDGVFINLRLNKANDLTPVLAELREQMPPDAHLVSLGPISHRFAYFYGEPIHEIDWPESYEDVTPESTYFCFDLHQGDNPLKRANGRGRRWARTLGTLPFAWEQIARIPCDPIRRGKTATTVVVGRVLGPGERPVPTAREDGEDHESATKPNSDSRY